MAAGNIVVTAADGSTVMADTLAASISVTAGAVAVNVSITVSLSTNEAKRYGL